MNDLKLKDLVPNAKNPRKISEKKREMLKKALEEFGDLGGIVYNLYTKQIVGGHQRRDAMSEAQITITQTYEAPTRTGTIAEGYAVIDGERFAYREVAWPLEKEKAANIAANKGAGSWDYPQLSEWLLELDHTNFDLDLTLFDEDERAEIMTYESKGSGVAGGESGPNLSERFGVPPFSVLDARQGYWQARKKHWISMGIESEAGRGENLLKMSDTMLEPDPEKRIVPKGLVFGEMTPNDNAKRTITGTSIFDPVLCELAYRWFCPPGGTILDPFSGGSVRGIVASKLNRQYIGVDLRKEQVDANFDQAMNLCQDPMPVWECGDSLNIKDIAKGVEADFLFTCPPYADLEVYSDNPADISTMEYEKFLEIYAEIIKKSLELLKNDRFAAIVVGDIRDKKGIYRNFVSHTIQAFEDAGARLYNEAILVTACGTLPLRAGKMFSTSRKLGKTHQNVLVFCKGDPKKATANCGEVEIGDLSEFEEKDEA